MTTEYSFEDLVEQGVFVLSGFAEDDGETLWSLDLEVAREKAPEIYWNEVNAIEGAVLEAVDEGWMELDFNPETMDFDYVVTEKGMTECTPL